jgi:hypothetical protein
MALSTGWMRLKIDPDAAAKQIISIGPGGAWITYFQSEATAWYCDPDAGIDTIISVINRYQNEDEIEIATVWRDVSGAILNRLNYESYYTQQTLIRASECIVPGVIPPGAYVP